MSSTHNSLLLVQSPSHSFFIIPHIQTIFSLFKSLYWPFPLSSGLASFSMEKREILGWDLSTVLSPIITHHFIYTYSKSQGSREVGRARFFTLWQIISLVLLQLWSLTTNHSQNVSFFQTSENFAHIVLCLESLSFLSSFYIYSLSFLLPKDCAGWLHVFQAPVSKENPTIEAQAGAEVLIPCDRLLWCWEPAPALLPPSAAFSPAVTWLPCSTAPCYLILPLSFLWYCSLSSLKNQWSINPCTVWNPSDIK